MAERMVKYFAKGGPENTVETLEISLQRAEELNLDTIIVASGGSTLLQLAEMIRTRDLDIVPIGVTLQAGTWTEYGEPDWDKIEQAKKLGAKCLTCTHALMGNVEASIKKEFGGLPPVELIARTYYTFSQGTKVAVEITMSVVDAGMVPTGDEIIAIAGSDRGADTALVLKAVSTVDFFDLRIKELLCKPR